MGTVLMLLFIPSLFFLDINLLTQSYVTKENKAFYEVIFHNHKLKIKLFLTY